MCCAMLSHSIMSNSLQPHGCSLPGSSVHSDSPDKNTGVGGHALLQGIFPTQGSKPGLPHCRQILYQLGENHFSVYIYPLPLAPPIPLVQHRAVSWAPCAISSFPLATCVIHGNVDMSMLLCQYLLPSPSPPVPTNPFYLRIYSCPTNRFFCTIFVVFTLHVNMIFFSFWLTSFCMTD